MSEGTSKAVVPAPTNGQPMAETPQTVRDFFGQSAGDVVMSFDLGTARGRELLQKCEEEPDRNVKDMVNLKLRLQHVYARKIELVNKLTGELVPATRVCLVTTDGKVYACVSEGVRKAVGRLIAGHGIPPWKQGVPVTVSLKTIGDGKQWMTLLEDFGHKEKDGEK